MSVADDVLAEALRAREEYRSRLRRLVHPLSNDELAAVYDAFKASEMPRDQDVAVTDVLIRADIRVACRREQNDRSAWAEVEKEVGS